MIDLLKGLPPNIVYTLAPKDFVLRGYDYFHKERLESLSWGKDRVRLIAVVRGTRRYGVEFTVDDESLSYFCPCPAWTPVTNCKHVICAILTVVNLLDPAHFNVSTHQPRRLEKLRTALLAGNNGAPSISKRGCVPETSSPLKPDKFELLIQVRDRYPELSVRNHGQRLYTLRGVPESLTYFVGDFYHSFPMHRDRFAQHLEAHGNSYRLLFQSEGEPVEVQWDAARVCQIFTEFNVVDGQVTIRPVYRVNGQEITEVRIFWEYVVDLQSRILMRVETPPEWDIQCMLYDEWMVGLETIEDEQTLARSRETRFWDREMNRVERQAEWQRFGLLERTPITIPLRRFQSCPIDIPAEHQTRTMERVVLKVNGNLTTEGTSGEPVEPQTARYRLVIAPVSEAKATTRAAKPMAHLRAECWWDDVCSAPHGPTFSIFSYWEQKRGLPAPLRTQKRKSVLYEALVKLFRAGEVAECERILRTVLSGQEFLRHQVKQSAKQLLKQAFSVFTKPEVRLQFHHGRWNLVPIDKAQEALFYVLAYEQFGTQLFNGMERHEEMTASLSLVQSRLPRLYDTCQAAGIQLFYHAKPVAEAEWEFALDARHPAGIDWFELRPEIRCNGVVMTDAAVQKVLQGGGVIEQEGAIHIFPAKTREMFQAFSSFYQDESNPKSRKKELVRVPRLQILDWIALRKQGVTIRLPPEDEAIIDRLTHFDQIHIPPLPSGLKAKLRAYQQSGYGWLAFLYQHRFGACLADDMGLGKTVQAISLLGGIKEGIIPSLLTNPVPHLIVLPPSLLFNWEQEIAKFYPGLRVQLYAGQGRVAEFNDCDVVLTTYGVVRRDIATLEKVPFHLVVFDEAQTVKNMYAETTSAVRRLRALFKMVMTGTPLENHVGEYFSIIDLCLPGLLGDYEKVKVKITNTPSSVIETLTRRTKPFVLRRTKEQILKELPPKIETDVYLDLTERQRALYQHTIAQIRPTIEDAYRTKTQAQARIIALTAILKLRQVCLSPKLVEASSHDTSPKITFLIERLAELMESGHSALVFSQFTSFLDLVEMALGSHHIPYARLDGSTPTVQRRALVQGFQEGARASVFLLSLKAGGQGLNLTKASYVFHLDPWWNPAVENQASDRAHRIGQTQTVSILRILMRHSIEEKMMELKKKKSALYQAVLEGTLHPKAGVGITKEDFDFLLA